MRKFGKLFAFAIAGLAVLAIALVALAWAPDRTVEQLVARWAPPPSQFVELDGMRVHVRDEGPRGGIPIILLHGTSASLHTWEGWVDKLKDRHRVISLDLPGFGLTGPFPDADYRLTRYLRFLTNFFDRMDAKRFVLVGNSFGGFLAWQFALAMPDRVDRLVLVDAGGYPQQARSIPIGFRIAGLPVVNQVARQLLPRSVIESSLRNVYGDPERVTAALVDRYFELTLRAGNRQALGQRIRQIPTGENAERIRDIVVPTLILWGGRDRLVPPETAGRFHADIRGSRLVVFDDLGHVPHEEDPARTEAALEQFLAGT
jgi:pimeloyl-ACP methyl ester carboxylesterase